jgi:hypothetical protein
MSDEIKVGDVCEMVDACCPTARSKLVGAECSVVAFVTGFPPFRCQWCNEVSTAFARVESSHHFTDKAALIRMRYAPTKYLRKKPPKADETIRQETVPLERYNEWLETTRRRGKVEEPA